jgi:hypothetical protein
MLAPSIFGGKYYGAFIDSDSDTDSASESSSAESTPEPPKDRRIFRNVTGLDIRITIYGGTDVSESDFVIAPFSSKTITYRGHFNYSVRELIPETFWSSFDGGDIITIDFHPTYKAKHGIK